MGFSEFWLQFNNGNKEKLNDTQHGIRKEQVDKKYHNLFDVYDENSDGMLERIELDNIFKGLGKFAGSDNVLDFQENAQIRSIFAEQTNIKDVDFQGFVKSISKASEDIVSSKETPTPDGGKEIRTEYKDGSVETISYYPDGAYKFKKTEKKVIQTHYFVELNGQKREVSKEQYQQALVKVKSIKNAKQPEYQDKLQNNFQIQNIKVSTTTTESPKEELELSDRAKFDVDVREFLLQHFIDTHVGTQEALDSMNILDDIGAAINAGAGELWNSCKNVYNKYFGEGSQQDYQNFYELVSKFEPNYNKALAAKGNLGVMNNHKEMYFRNFETDYTTNTGNKYNLEKTLQFKNLAEQYQSATILKQRVDILKKAMSEIRMYWSEQQALVNAPAQNEGLNPASHIVNANNLLLAYFKNDQEAADMVLNGTIGNPDATQEKIKELLEETQAQLGDCLIRRSVSVEESSTGSLEVDVSVNGNDGDYTYEELQEKYKAEYKEMYGTDFVPDELADKVMDAKATGGMVKIAAVTIISILITKSPIMTQAMGAAAGSAEVTGATANFIRGLVAKYGQTAVQQGIKFAMTTGTLASDFGLTLLGQVTDNRDGVQWNEVWDSTKGAAKYIYFGAYIGSPIAQAVSQRIGQIGLTGRLLEGGTKTTQGAVQTTTISGEKLLANFMKGSNSLFAKGAGFATDVGLFTGLEIATEGANPLDAVKEQGEMLGKLKIMNGFIEYMLGAKAHTAIEKTKWEVAIDKSGVKNWEIKEIKIPSSDGKGFKSVYTVDYEGIPLGKFEDINKLATAIMERVSMVYNGILKTETKTDETNENTTVDDTQGRETVDGTVVNLQAPTDDNTVRPTTQNATSPIQEAHLTREETINALKELGLSKEDIAQVNLENPALSIALSCLQLMKKYAPEEFGASTSALVNALNHPENYLDEDVAPFVQYMNIQNIDKLKEVAVVDEGTIESLVNYNMPELYRIAQQYYETTGEKFDLERVFRNNSDLTGKKAVFPTKEQLDIAIKMEKAELWNQYNMLGHSTDAEPFENVDEVIEKIKFLKEKAKSQGIDLDIEYDLSEQAVIAINKLKEIDEKSPIDFSKIVEFACENSNPYIDPSSILFYLKNKNKRIDSSRFQTLLNKITNSMNSRKARNTKIEFAQFLIDNNILSSLSNNRSFLSTLDGTNVKTKIMGYIEHKLNPHQETEFDVVMNVIDYINDNNIELAKVLITNDKFPKYLISDVLQAIKSDENSWLDGFEIGEDDNSSQYESSNKDKAKFAIRLCTDTSLNCPPLLIKRLISNLKIGYEDTIINALKEGLLDKYPDLVNYSADCWDNIIKRGLLNNEDVKSIPAINRIEMIESYARAKNDNILELHKQLIQDALANKDLLKSGLEDITDGEIEGTTTRRDAVYTIDLIGLGNTEAAFPLMLEEFGEFMIEVANLDRQLLSEGNKELLRQKINPQSSQRYQELNNEITGLKKKLNEVVGADNLARIKELQAQKAQIDEQIKQLKQGENAETPEVKQQVKELQKQSKTLGSQAQSIYYQGENAAQVKEIMKDISNKQKELKEFLLQNSGLEPQEVVTKLRVLSALAEISTEEEITDFINMIKPSTPENDAIWNEAVNKKIYQKLGVEYDEALSQKLDLIHCKYISKLFISSDEFFDNMKTLVEIVRDNQNLTIEQAIDQMPQNVETKRIFEELGFDYEKFTKVDKNSYTTVEIELNAEEAKQAAIHNLEEDLNDALFQSLPKEVTEPIFKHLKEQLGVTFEKSQKDNWEGDGFSAGSTEYYRLYKNGKPIIFEDMDDIVSLIKKEVISNDFWTKKHYDPQIDNARGTMYTHLIKMRTQEVDNASSIKDGETAEIEVRKTDMYDIKKALGLGNDAQCCTALGRNFNEWSAPTYIMNKCIGAIELTDKGSFVGNTMIYLAYVDGKPALVLDNIELKTKYQNNDKIRDTFVDYAKKLCAEIGQPDLPIFAGPNRHKLNMDIYDKSTHTMEIIGNSGEQEVYVDYDADRHVVGEGEQAEIEMYRLR